VLSRLASRYSFAPNAALIIAGVGTILQTTYLAFVSSKGLMDFDTYWHVGRAVLDGVNPYPPVDARVLGTQQQFVYPAPAALFFAPFALLPLRVAEVIWYVISLSSALGAFWLVGIRDRRVFLAILCSMWLIQGLYVGTVTPVLLLGLALAWRWRDHRYAGALALAVVIAIKLFPAPLVVWLWVSGRRVQAMLACVASGLLLLAGWALIGFDGLSTYKATLDLLSQLLSWAGFSITGLGQALGLSYAVSRDLAITLAVATILAATVLGRRDERHAFLLCLVASLCLSPIVWMNYLSLPMLGLALYRRRIAFVWLAPIAIGVIPHAQSEAHVWRHLLWDGAVALVVCAAIFDADLRVTARARSIARLARKQPAATETA
jgi:hypothetical protein